MVISHVYLVRPPEKFFPEMTNKIVHKEELIVKMSTLSSETWMHDNNPYEWKPN